MTDRERMQLRGPVRSCHLERRWYSRRCGADTCDIEERGDASTVEFRNNGNLSRRLHRNPDGSEWTCTYVYDDRDKLIEMQTEAAAELVGRCVIYEYDDHGRLLQVLNRNEAGDCIVETYEYDTAGCWRKTTHVEAAAQSSNMSWGVDGTDSCYSAPGAAKLITTYNQRDQPIKLSFLDPAGRELSRVEFEYDRAGRLVQEAQVNSQEVLPPEMMAAFNPAQLDAVRGFFGAGREFFRRTHAYDDCGRRIETRSHLGPLSFDVKAVTFNEQGDPMTEVFEDEEGDIGIDDEGQVSTSPSRENVTRSEARLRYDYDSHQNWVSKTVETRSGSENEFVLSMVERRTITYFV